MNAAMKPKPSMLINRFTTYLFVLESADGSLSTASASETYHNIKMIAYDKAGKELNFEGPGTDLRVWARTKKLRCSIKSIDFVVKNNDLK